MKRIARRHRIAHLRALMTQRPAGSVRKEDLAALLREEMTVPRAKNPRRMRRPSSGRKQTLNSITKRSNRRWHGQNATSRIDQ
jgi:hypothetical protein